MIFRNEAIEMLCLSLHLFQLELMKQMNHSRPSIIHPKTICYLQVRYIIDNRVEAGLDVISMSLDDTFYENDCTCRKKFTDL